MSPATVSDAIAGASDDLTPTERRIAEAVVAEPTLLAFGTVSDLAEQVGTSRPSIVRFARKLGFDGYPALQETARDGLTRRLTRPTDRFRSEATTRHDDVEALTTAVRDLGPLVTGRRLAVMAKRIGAAQAVWIASGETSMAAAHALRSGLGIIRPDVTLLEGDDLARHLVSAGPQDVAIVTDFFRYRRAALVAARGLAARGVPIIAVTDGPLSPLAPLADELVEVRVPAIGPFDSSVPTVALAELIVAEVARVDRAATQDRIDHTEQLWHTTGTFVEDE